MVGADTVAYYVNSLSAGQASPHWYTEDGGIFAIGTARVGWRTNTNLIFGANDATVLTVDTSGNGTFVGSIKTADPGSGAGAWKLGKLVTAAVTPDTTRYVEVEVDGIIRKMIIST